MSKRKTAAVAGTSGNKVMETPQSVEKKVTSALSGCCEQWGGTVRQTEDFIREKPLGAVLVAVFAGFILNLLPIGILIGSVVRLAFVLLRPVLLLLGAFKIWELTSQRPSSGEQ